MQKTINCPLCHAIGVIIYTDSKEVTTVNPTVEESIGNYSRDFVGGRYDWSHAKSCPKLVKAFDKKLLLESYITSEPSVMKSDLNSYEDYSSTLMTSGIGLGMDVIRTQNQTWEFMCYAYSRIAKSDGKYIKSTARDPEKAFSLFKHRLLCGQLLYASDPPFQLVQNSNLVFAPIKTCL